MVQESLLRIPASKLKPPLRSCLHIDTDNAFKKRTSIEAQQGVGKDNPFLLRESTRKRSLKGGSKGMPLEAGRESGETAMCHCFIALPHPHPLFKIFSLGQKDGWFISSFELSIFNLGCSNSEVFVVFCFVLFLIFMEFVSLQKLDKIWPNVGSCFIVFRPEYSGTTCQTYHLWDCKLFGLHQRSAHYLFLLKLSRRQKFNTQIKYVMLKIKTFQILHLPS